VLIEITLMKNIFISQGGRCGEGKFCILQRFANPRSLCTILAMVLVTPPSKNLCAENLLLNRM
jgi:hypothetical protein